MKSTAMSKRTIVGIVVAAALVAIAVFWILMSRADPQVETSGNSGRSAAATDTPTDLAPSEDSSESIVPTSPSTPVIAPPAAPAPAPAPSVAVTRETGESVCYVKDAYTKAGQDYVVVDYIQLGTIDRGSEDYDVINQNPRLRTFEFSDDSWLGAYWMAQQLYGDSVMYTWNTDGSIPYGKGTALKRSDFMRAADEGTVNDHSYWYIRVSDGVVLSLVNTYQD